MKNLWQKLIWLLVIMALIILLASCNGKIETGLAKRLNEEASAFMSESTEKASEQAYKPVLYCYSHLRTLEKVEDIPADPNQDEDESYEYPSNELAEEEEYEDFDKEVNEDPYEGSDEKPFWWTDETLY